MFVYLLRYKYTLISSWIEGLGGLKETKMFLPHSREKLSIVGSLRDRDVPCSASDRQGSNFESCVFHLPILRSVSWPSLAYMWTKVASSLIHFILFFLDRRSNRVISVRFSMFNPYSAAIFVYHGNQRVFFQFEIIIN